MRGRVIGDMGQAVDANQWRGVLWGNCGRLGTIDAANEVISDVCEVWRHGGPRGACALRYRGGGEAGQIEGVMGLAGANGGDPMRMR
jgi:hypothetical protein